MTTNPHDLTVRRAALAEVLLPADIALALGVSEKEAVRCAAAGLLGPAFLISGRPAVLRTSFLEHLRKAASSPPEYEVLRPGHFG